MSNFNFTITPEVSTGNYTAINDAYDTTKHNNGARIQPGLAFFLRDASDRVIKCRYVRYNPAVAITEIVGPVFWDDALKTTVVGKRSESLYGDTINAGAGILLNASVTPGNWTVIQVAGFRAAIAVPASTAPSDALVSATGDQQWARVAAGTAPTAKPMAFAITAVSGGNSDVEIACESF